MTYRYADGSRFPLDDNFVETLQAMTNACVALLVADEACEQSFLARSRAQTASEETTVKLRNLADTLTGTIARCTAGEASTVVQAVASRLDKHVEDVIDAARRAVEKRRDDTVSLLARSHPGARVVRIVEGLLSRYEMPHTSWTLTWRLDDGNVGGELTCRAPCGLEASFRLDLPADHPLARARRVGDLQRGVAVPLDTVGMLGRIRQREITLDRYHLRELEVGPGRTRIVASKRRRGGGAAVEVLVPASADRAPEAVTIGGDLVAETGNPVEGEAAHGLRRLAARLGELVADVVPHRREMLSARCGERAVEELPRPAAIAEAMLAAIAPLVREMRRRGSRPGELSLKRDSGDGRREEFFVDTGDLARRISGLPSRYRQLFECFGLVFEDEAPLEAPSRRGRPHLTAV